MKKKYTTPEMEIALFETSSIMLDASAPSVGLEPGGVLGTDEAIEPE